MHVVHGDRKGSPLLYFGFAGGLDASAYGGGVLGIAFVSKFLIVDAGDFDVDVNAVEEGAEQQGDGI